MKALHMVTFLLLVIGGLAWGLHAFGYNPVDRLGAEVSMIVYVLVGLSALVELGMHKQNCKCCSADSKGM